MKKQIAFVLLLCSASFAQYSTPGQGSYNAGLIAPVNVLPAGATSSSGNLYTLPVAKGAGYYIRMGANDSVWYNGTNNVQKSDGSFAFSTVSTSFVAQTNFIMIRTVSPSQVLTANVFALAPSPFVYGVNSPGSFQFESTGSTNDLHDPEVFGSYGSGLILTHNSTNSIPNSIIIGGSGDSIFNPPDDFSFTYGSDGAILFSVNSSMGCDAESVIIGGSQHKASIMTDSTIIGGNLNTASVNGSVIIGTGNHATNAPAVVIGSGNVVNANGGSTFGGANVVTVNADTFGHGLANSTASSAMYGNGSQSLLFTSAGWTWTGVPVGSGSGLTNVVRLGNGAGGVSLATNSTLPSSTTIIRAWVSITNETGGVFKMPLYQ